MPPICRAALRDQPCTVRYPTPIRSFNTRVACVYAFTALLGLLLLSDLLFASDAWHDFARWFGSAWGVPLPLSNKLFGLSLALYAAMLGGALRAMAPSTRCWTAGLALIWPSRSRASPPFSCRNRSSPPRSCSSAWSANVWKHHVRRGRSGPCADRRDLPAPLLASARRPGRARSRQ